VPSHPQYVPPAIGRADQADTLEQFVGSRCDQRRRQAVQHSLQMQQFVTRHQRIDCRILQGNADVASHVVGLSDDVEPGDLGRPRCRLQQCGQHADDRALACSVRAEKAEDLTPVNLEVDAIDRLHGAEMTDESRGDDRGLIGIH
jgi:hypothetical protein